MRVLPFEEVIQDASGGNAKVQKGDYLTAGAYPIVDQGQEFIGGFSNDQGDLVKGEGPWIVFGDHTRALKFIETPFCMGADGVKVLRLKQEGAADLKYIFHFLQHSNIPSAGYSRHYKFLKRLEIPLLPLDEQKRIAAILDKANALRAKRRQAIALLDSLNQSIFLEMFGDLTQWPTLKLAELTDEFRYGTSEKSQAVGHPTLRIPNVVGGSVSLSDLKFVPVNERKLDRLRLQDGDILFVRTNGNKDYVGRSAVVTTKIESGTGYVLSDFIYASYLIRARVKQDEVNPHFLQAFLSGAAGRKMLLERAKTSAGQYNINTEGLGSINIPIPPMGKQEAFQSTIEKLSESLDACRLNLGQVDVLLASLQHRSFTGQL